MLIAIEGIDGSGKGTQARLLVERAHTEGLSAASVSFPRYELTASSALIADYLNGGLGALNEVSPYLASTLFALDRLESRRHLDRLLSTHDLVVTDRYVGSNLAYQGARVIEENRDEFFDWLAHLEFDVYGLSRPDLTLFFDTSPEVSANLVAQKERRVYTGAIHDLHEEDHEYQSKVRMAYKHLMAEGIFGLCVSIKCLKVDGTMRRISEIHSMAWGTVRKRMDELR